jgi:hypothetical protein
MIKIFLDDIRVPLDESWIIIKSYSNFIDFIIIQDFNFISEISLDHDLGLNDNLEDEKTGYDVAKWLVNYSIDNNIILPIIKVHSANPVGSLNIISYINNYLISNQQKPTCIQHIVELKRGIKLNLD